MDLILIIIIIDCIRIGLLIGGVVRIELQILDFLSDDIELLHFLIAVELSLAVHVAKVNEYWERKNVEYNEPSNIYLVLVKNLVIVITVDLNDFLCEVLGLCLGQYVICVLLGHGERCSNNGPCGCTSNKIEEILHR